MEMLDNDGIPVPDWLKEAAAKGCHMGDDYVDLF